jgi:hypothetical protein
MAKPLLNDDMQQQICDLLKIGVPIADVCGQVGICEKTFYNWRTRGIQEESRLNHEPNARPRKKEQLYLQFLQESTRAIAEARVTAVVTLRGGMEPQVTKTRTIDVFSETRLDKKGQPYEYIKKTQREVTTTAPGDWRAAVEYLKRRDSDRWSDKVKIEDWRSQVIADIKAGIIQYEVLEQAFDTDLATELFTAAGVRVQAS